MALSKLDYFGPGGEIKSEKELARIRREKQRVIKGEEKEITRVKFGKWEIRIFKITK